MDDHAKTEFALALKVLTRAILSDRDNRSHDRTRFGVRTAADLMSEPVPSREQSRLRKIVEDPLEGAYLLAVHRLGEALFRAGGLDLMLAISDLACSSAEDGSHRSLIIDHAWNGIGSDEGGHWLS